MFGWCLPAPLGRVEVDGEVLVERPPIGPNEDLPTPAVDTEAEPDVMSPRAPLSPRALQAFKNIGVID